MTEILTTGDNRRRPGIGRAKRSAARIDMTPMVDLGFLLITFFVMTSELSRPATVNLKMPKDGQPMDLGKANALTILLGRNDHAYYYHGDWNEARAKNQIVETNPSVNHGFGAVIREKQQWLDLSGGKEGRNGLMLLIKASKEASYQNVMNALDETMINDIRKYAILSPTSDEIEWLKTRGDNSY